MRHLDAASIVIDPQRSEALQLQIYEQIRQLIIVGSLRAGTRVTPTRELCAQLGVSRNTVAFAYQKLTAEGYLCARPAAGTLCQQPSPGRCAPAPPCSTPSPCSTHPAGASEPDPAEAGPGISQPGPGSTSVRFQGRESRPAQLSAQDMAPSVPEERHRSALGHDAIRRSGRACSTCASRLWTFSEPPEASWQPPSKR
jgi:DNA-binding transcriptional MocR family regulator